MEPRGLAHECRVEATALRAGNAADPAAIAGILEQCATTLEEMDATDRAAVPVTGMLLEKIEADALRIYREAGRHGEQGQQMERVDSYASLLSECVIDLCAYLKKEKTLG